jgi:hypothetical protein
MQVNQEVEIKSAKILSKKLFIVLCCIYNLFILTFCFIFIYCVIENEIKKFYITYILMLILFFDDFILVFFGRIQNSYEILFVSTMFSLIPQFVLLTILMDEYNFDGYILVYISELIISIYSIFLFVIYLIYANKSKNQEKISTHIYNLH